MSKGKAKEKVCYVDMRKINIEWVFYLGILSACWLLNLIFLFYYLSIENPIGVLFGINFWVLLCVAIYYQSDKYEPMYKRHYVGQEE